MAKDIPDWLIWGAVAVAALWFINTKVFDIGVGLDTLSGPGWAPQPGYENKPPYFQR